MNSLLVTRSRFPFLYCLLMDEYLYIGMTLNNPILRWANSIQIGGSFQRAMQNKNESIYDQNLILKSACYACNDVGYKLEQADWRNAICHAEELLHLLFSADRFILGKEIFIISDTTRTAPRRCRHKWVEQEAEAAYNYFTECLSQPS